MKINITTFECFYAISYFIRDNMLFAKSKTECVRVCARVYENPITNGPHRYFRSNRKFRIYVARETES